MATPGDHQARLRAALEAMRKQQARIDRLERQVAGLNEPIAVVGIGCRFPGGADGPAAFWDRLERGFDAIREMPADRWPVDAFFDPDPDAPGCVYTRCGGFLDAVDRFDARFFQISPREAQTMDPQQRLLLEVSWHALEHAGIPPDSLAGSATGVFVGLTAIDYARLVSRDDLTQIDTYSATGNVANIAAGRLSYAFGLRGPSLAVDTACSSSLVSLHLACQSLRTGECEMALAAGVNVMLAPDNFVAVSRAHMLSPDGRCKAFDRAADGYGRSEGCGVVVLKRLSTARAAGDRVLGLVLGSAVRQDGQRSGLTVPNGPAQVAVMRAALAAAGVSPEQVGYLEAHGTGTALGDPIEIEALGSVYAPGRDPGVPLVVGSLKTNVGHMESAAGIGGVIKALLTVAHGEIPPHLHFREANPEISLEDAHVTIPVQLMPWPSAHDRRIAAVSSFGSSGTIAHVLVSAAAAAERPPRGLSSDAVWTLPLSARTDRALEELAASYRDRLGVAAEDEVGDICFTAACGRAHFGRRLTVEGRSAAELIDHLDRGVAGTSEPARAYLAGRPVDWAVVFRDRGCARVDAPVYPFQRERCWVDAPATPRPTKRGAAVPPPGGAAAGVRFGVMFFNGTQARDGSDSYRMVIEASRFADGHGFSSVWLPERHFTEFGSLYPNPATIHAALARETRSVRLMAGSVVLPLHNPLRLAEEWAAVDNLSGGRVGISFASGWNPDDFALDPDRYADRRDELFRGVDTLQRLWRGEQVRVRNGVGADVRIRTFPTPVQPELPLWITAAGNPETFRHAGAVGAHLLTHLLDHDADELADKIQIYRRARAEHGHDPAAGQVTVMLHTFIGDTVEGVHQAVRAPYCQYLKDNIHLLKGLATARGSQAELDALSPDDLDGFVAFLYNRFFSTRALLGTVDSCLPLVERLEEIGVDEIACLLDFGPSTREVLAHLPHLVDLARTPRRIGHGPKPSTIAPLTGATYGLAWEPIDVTRRSGSIRADRVRAQGPWAVVTDRGVVGAAVAAELRAAGADVRVLDAAALDEEDGARVLSAVIARAGCREVVCDWHVALPEDDADALAGSLMRVARLVRGLSQGSVAAASRLWFVTSGGATDASSRTRPTQQALAGFVRVLPIEQLALWGGLIDVDADASAARVLDVILHDGREDQCAVRGEHIFAPRLTPEGDTPPAAVWACRADATYLVTGGFGGIGLGAARWLAGKGARRVILAGRTPLAADDPRIDALRAVGLDVECAAVDIADAPGFSAWLRRRADEGGAPIAGVVHAAGTWDDRHLADLDEATLRAVLAPKVAGTLSLDGAFPAGVLDWFIVFSAFSSYLPAERQADYATANASPDAVVPRRRAAGDRAIAINWAVWAGIGFGATDYGRRAHDRLALMGIGRIAPEQGWATLDAFVAANRSGVGVMPIDWRRLFQADPNARLSPVLGRLVATWATQAGPEGAAGQVAERISRLPSEQQLAGVEIALTAIVATMMRVEPRELQRDVSLAEFGLDSLMAVEIKNRVQHDTGVNLPLVRLLEGPSLAELAVAVLASIKVSDSSLRRRRPRRWMLRWKTSRSSCGRGPWPQAGPRRAAR